MTFFQVQSWPTPEIFIKQADGGFEDTGTASLALVNVVFVLPQQTVVDDTPATAAIALQALVVNGALPRPVTEDTPPTSALALESVVNVTAITQTQTESTTAAVALDSLVNMTPQTQIESELTPPTAALALESIAV